MKRKTLTFIIALAVSIFAYADTPLAQALKVQRHLTDVKNAIQSRGIECPNLESMSNAVMQINDINQFASGTYSGTIQITAQNVNWLAFNKVPGNYNIYAQNLRSVCDSAYRYAYGLNEFYAPLCSSAPEYMLADCTNLKYVYMPKCSSIATYAFQNSGSLEYVDISNVSTINGSQAFENCYNLKYVKTKPLTYCASYCFKNCNNLTNIILAENFSCSYEAFKNCYNLNVKLPKKFSGYNYAMFENCRSITEIDLSDEDTTRLTHNNIFNGCSGVTNLNLGPVKELCGDWMFSNLGITTFSNEVLECIGKIDDNSCCTFANNKQLKSIYLPKLQAITHGIYTGDDPGAFGGCTKLEEVYMPELYVIGKINTSDGEDHYSSRTFIDCVSLKSISLPKLRELHGCKTFYNCSSLTNIYMPSLKHWSNGYEGWYASGMGHCKSLKRIHLPNLERISFGWQMFYNCYNLEEVVFPKLTKITYYYNSNINMERMFEYCHNLKNVTFGYKADDLMAVYAFPGSAPLTTVFHCVGDAPNIVDIVYKNGSWQKEQLGTYKLVDYIKGTGTQYLNTGVIHNNNTKIICDCEIGDSTGGYKDVFGARNGSHWNNSFTLFSRYLDNKIFCFSRSGNEMQGSTYENGYFHIVAENNVCNIYNAQNELIQSITSTGNNDNGIAPIGIFVINNATSEGGFTPIDEINANMKLYRFQIYKDDVLQCDLVPALANNDVPCMVDLANNYHPHFNYGTGDFEYGSVTNDNIVVTQP